MIGIQSLPCFEQSRMDSKCPGESEEQTEQTIQEKDSYSFGNTGNFSDGVLLNQQSAYYFRHLIKKYKKHMGEELGTSSVCSGGLQQYLIKQHERQERLKTEQDETTQHQSKFECLRVDVRLHIFSFLTATELCKASQVCRSWYDITEDNLLWAGLLERDIPKWDVIGHNTNPAMYKEVESEWSNKEIYLRCSPEVNTLMHQQNALINNLTSMLRYFFPKKTPMLAMFGPGLESQTSGLVRKIMNGSMFESTGLFPGKFDGVGGGITLKSPEGAQFHWSVMYSASKKEREQSNRDRSHKHRMMRERRDSDGNERFELVPAVQDFCKTVDGFIYVVDATEEAPAVETGLNELEAMLSERWSATHVPVLVLATTLEATTPRLSCFEVVERLKLSQLSRPWQVRSSNVESLDGLVAGFQWLAEQSQRKY
ncbi:F-box only protein 4-like [Mya arenaria]|uniref:F-box only protein 4-like n=1 Tax=Mya arenaria TaxID=6604 RepID=UPI0022E115D4|nr:F-box only protein 4-like [Mya arenaria]